MNTFKLNSGHVVVAWPKESNRGDWPKQYMGARQAEAARAKLPSPEMFEVWRSAAGRSYYLKLKEEIPA